MELTKSNFELYAAKHYQKDKWATTEDFKEDISRFKYINRLVNRYYRDDDLKERLILNHIIILGNVLGPKICAEILMCKTHDVLKSTVKTFLVYLNYLPEEEFVEVPLDVTIIDVLRKL
jgi:hypothetical protein|tara:strand:- start:2280 stop:2636 length:357 start_codon:yes stop_codon:yes gene_type:complete